MGEDVEDVEIRGLRVKWLVQCHRASAPQGRGGGPAGEMLVWARLSASLD